jgi:hypothetical protein
VSGSAEVAELRRRLEEIAESLSTLALERLREGARGQGEERGALAEERRLTRARRAVERALSALREPEEA